MTPDLDEDHATNRKTTRSSSDASAGPIERTCHRGILHIICLSHVLFKHALDYRTYCLAYRSARYNQAMGKKIWKYSKPIEVQLRSKHFNSSDPAP